MSDTTETPTPAEGVRVQGGSLVRDAARAVGHVRPRQWLALLLRGVGFACLFVVYQTIEAEGLREIFGDVVGKRLSKAFPLLTGWMGDFEETHRLDMANALAALFLVFTYLSWEAVIGRLVVQTEDESRKEKLVVLVPAVVLLVIDTILFAAGVAANGSFRTPIPPLLLALAYDAMLILFSYWVVNIARRRT